MTISPRQVLPRAVFLPTDRGDKVCSIWIDAVHRVALQSPNGGPPPLGGIDCRQPGARRAERCRVAGGARLEAATVGCHESVVIEVLEVGERDASFTALPADLSAAVGGIFGATPAGRPSGVALGASASSHARLPYTLHRAQMMIGHPI